MHTPNMRKEILIGRNSNSILYIINMRKTNRSKEECSSWEHILKKDKNKVFKFQ